MFICECCQGIAGGELVITPVDKTGFEPEDAAIVGNTCLYGATGGQVFVRGRAGERFAVRNSLAEAVVEGAGDHCCEYMTGGCVVVLGKWVLFLYQSYSILFLFRTPFVWLFMERIEVNWGYHLFFNLWQSG